MTDTKHIFISYAREDGAAFAQQLDDALRAKKHLTWRDTRGIDPAKDFTAEIEVAIKAASYVVVCITPDTERDNSFVRREIQYALVVGKPVIVAKVDATIPPIHVINNTWVEFDKGWGKAFAQLDSILQKSPDDYHPPELSPQTADPFRPYLENLYERIVRFLDQAVIKLIDLTPEDTPDAVKAPPQRKDMLDLFFEAQGIGEEKPTAPKSFHTFAEAFEHYEGRVLLLGEPGAGKTITLFAFARDAVAKRLNDVNAPLPLLGLISSWDAKQRISLAEWLARGYPELDMGNLKNMLSMGHVLLLLDGLDELGRERLEHLSKPNTEKQDPRERLMNLIPNNNQVVVTCRLADYRDIGRKIALNGAATLRPLDDIQMQVYLAKQPELWMAVKTDSTLRSLLQTPLLISFFAYAYRGMSKDELKQVNNLARSSATLRNRIFENYVRERFYHEERKNKCKLMYDYDTTHRLLGQAAIWGVRKPHETQISRIILKEIINDDPSEFIQQCQQLHLLVSIDDSYFRFIHLYLHDYFAVGAFIEVLKDPDVFVRREAAERLGQIGDKRATRALIGAIYDNDSMVRCSIAWALNKAGDKRAVKHLIKLLEDKYIGVRYNAAEALGNIGDKRAVEPLINLLANCDDDDVRRNAIVALGRIGNEKAINPLIELLKDYSVRNSVIGSLSGIGQPAVEYLIAAMKNTSLRVCSGVARVLGEIRDKRAVEPLITALGISDFEVRANAAWALGQIKDKRAVEPLIAVLQDKSFSVRDNATVALGKIGDSRAVEALAVKLDDDVFDVRRDTIRALGQIGDIRSVKKLIEKLQNDYVLEREEAAEALKRIGTQEALEAVQKWREEQRKKQ